MNLYFGSGIMNNESLRKAQQNRRMNYGRIWRFRESKCQFFGGAACLRTPYTIRAFER